ncbi:hypothetical protein [Kribbella kalugense]|uniref:Uncharacterized protein n=1 Tax=Kribbella kalugense TaxID=2512221 RepID=A0A4R7ZBQ7_9ACTN|nr:hypothetical protein [Kribbella kalugense]TDW14256.1 hypothetical protein EV650_7840 [Kribbella kalugense]
MTNWWAERRQNEQLDLLNEEMSSARQATSRLQSQLSQLQGGLQERVNRLSTAFDAFVELSDLRYEMTGFVEAAELRRYATRVLTAMASGTELPPACEPVPQYWLGPATEALIASGQDSPALGTAMALDERRTSIFLTLALAALGQRHQVRSEWLDVAFGVPAADGTVTRVQRVLWATAARGGFGADGLALVVKRLQSVTPPTGGWLADLEKRGDGSRAAGPRFEAIAEQEKARTRLTRIHNAVEAIATNTEAREPATALTADVSTQDSPAALLRLLISEGSEPEHESLARVAVLRAQITGSDESAAQTLEDSVGTVEKLLTDDLTQTADPHLAAAVLRVIGPSVLPAVEDLAQVAGRPSPLEVSVESGVHTVTVRPDGPDQLELNNVRSLINGPAGKVTRGKLAVPAVLAGVGAVVAIGLGFVHPLWIAAGLVLVAIGGFQYWNLRVAGTHDKTTAANRIANLNEDCSTAAAQLAEYAKASESRQASITADLSTIRQHLTA